jgi:sugar phosphate isomerase/epimerase
MSNPISVSSAPIARLGDKEYYDLIGTLEVLKRVQQTSAMDGFEFQLEPEWDSEKPPLTDTELADWTKTPKYTLEEIQAILRRERLPILSVHASRDIGNYLCSNRQKDQKKGRKLLNDSLSFTESLGVKICVFHLWDTWRDRFDTTSLRSVFLDVSNQFPKVKASVENIPTHLSGRTPFTLVKSFDWVTLDLRWAVLYDELDTFEPIADRIVNVHLRGKLEGSRWVLEKAKFSFYEALNKIRNEWKYSGPLTVEPEGGIKSSSFEDFVNAMKTLKA